MTTRWCGCAGGGQRASVSVAAISHSAVVKTTKLLRAEACLSRHKMIKRSSDIQQCHISILQAAGLLGFCTLWDVASKTCKVKYYTQKCIWLHSIKVVNIMAALVEGKVVLFIQNQKIWNKKEIIQYIKSIYVVSCWTLRNSYVFL